MLNLPGHSRGGLFGSYAGKQFLQLLALLVEAAHLLEDTKRDMVAARLTGTLAARQVGIFSNHVFTELVLPPGRLLFVAYDFFGSESAVCSQRDKRKVTRSSKNGQ